MERVEWGMPGQVRAAGMQKQTNPPSAASTGKRSVRSGVRLSRPRRPRGTIAAMIAMRRVAPSSQLSMPKPFTDKTGSGLHVHTSLWSTAGDELFLDEDDSRGLGLSEMAYSFMAGVIDHARPLAALILGELNEHLYLLALLQVVSEGLLHQVLHQGLPQRVTSLGGRLLLHLHLGDRRGTLLLL